MRQIEVRQTGGPEVLIWTQAEPGEPGPNEVRVRNAAVGLNFLDVYFRSGRYQAPLPFVPGHEGAGVIEAVGSGVKDLEAGDRVGYIDPMGAYAEVLLRPADRLVKLPDSISDDLAASMLLKGITAEYLVRRTHAVAAGETILVHAAAGGVGQLLCQWANAIGATVIGNVGSAAKADIAHRVGCRHVIVAEQENFVERVGQIDCAATFVRKPVGR
jgi:NADPH:quinone reductase